ncbi:MAG TPA: SWIM zinc finger domain-containing protein [Polyangium sp.]|nr:SWIM zinc finger domain-containing protein [Polyangium sp.]
MNVDLRYLGKSSVLGAAQGLLVKFSPNLARPKTFFDAELRDPVRFREAVSALHDVVIGDLRFKKKDKTAYEAWKKGEAEREAQMRADLFSQAKRDELAKLSKEPIPPNLEGDFRKMHRLYWDARVRWANELARNDPEMFRHLVPCDPVVTVAPDVVFFECFSKDESSYGCLSVDRNSFIGSQEAGLGTTNVDYSLALYEHFQTLRTYRKTRLSVDPTGFDVKVEGLPEYREEKIDLPPSWLRGFGQIQAATCLPSRRVDLPIEVVYSILAYLKRHREKTGPRSIRFLLTPGKAPKIILDPWGIEIESKGPVYDGGLEIGTASGGGSPYRSAPRRASNPTEEIKVWGRRRLFSLARVLPLADRVEVRLLGSGLPSVWIAHMGDMRLVLALSGWTTNDWTSGVGLDLLAGSRPADMRIMGLADRFLQKEQRANLAEIAAATGSSEENVVPALHKLAKQGQLIFDHADQVYRYRQVMPDVLGEALLGPEHPELVEGRRLAQTPRTVVISRNEAMADARRILVAKVEGTSCEAIFDADLVIKKAKCTCSFFHKSGLRAGPCRHLLALRMVAEGQTPPEPPVAAPVATPPPRVTSSSSSAASSSRSSSSSSSSASSSSSSSSSSTSSSGSKWSSGEAYSLPREILDDVRKTALRKNTTISRVFEEAWDIGMPQIQAERSWTAAIALAEARMGNLIANRVRWDVAQERLALAPDVIAELTRVANRFRADRSAVLCLAWLLAKKSL